MGPDNDALEYKRGAGVPQGKAFSFAFAANDSKISRGAIDRKGTGTCPCSTITSTLLKAARTSASRTTATLDRAG